MKYEIQRNILSNLAKIEMNKVCAPPPYLRTEQEAKAKECLCASHKKGSLTIEAALILPFFMMVLFSFFSLFYQYSTAAQLKLEAAVEAKKVAIAAGVIGTENTGDITISKTQQAENYWNPFLGKAQKLTQSAVCRAWVGFTELGEQEAYVYITPEGEVYHLTAACTHLALSTYRVSLEEAKVMKNEYGERYQCCERCRKTPESLVYITREGNRYHSEADCSGLKRTVRMVPLSSVADRTCCLRCRDREE